MTQEVAVRPGEAGPAPFVAETIFEQVERAYPPARREQVAQFLSIPGDHPALVPFLAIAAAYDLNPFLGEMWLIPQQVREKVNGRWETVGTKYSPTIGRDGLLSRARRDPSYLGHKVWVVCENDEWEMDDTLVDFMAPPKIKHVVKGGRAQRGAVIGAYCLVGLRNRPFFGYWADITEHGRTRQTDNGVKWDAAWAFTSAMIAKSATSYAHRLSLGITGLLPIDELTPQARADQGILTEGAEPSPEPDGGSSVDLRGYLAETLSPKLADDLLELTEDWEPARREMTLLGRTADQLSALIEDLGAVDATVVVEEDKEPEVKDPEPPPPPQTAPLRETEDAPDVDAPLTGEAASMRMIEEELEPDAMKRGFDEDAAADEAARHDAFAGDDDMPSLL